MRLICMSFDGEFKAERPVFESAQDAWEYSNDLGSKWYFYPFHFVVTDSLITVIEAPLPWGIELDGKRVSTVQRMMKEHSKREDMQDEGVDVFWLTLQEEF